MCGRWSNPCRARKATHTFQWTPFGSGQERLSSKSREPLHEKESQSSRLRKSKSPSMAPSLGRRRNPARRNKSIGTRTTIHGPSRHCVVMLSIERLKGSLRPAKIEEGIVGRKPPRPQLRISFRHEVRFDEKQLNHWPPNAQQEASAAEFRTQI